MNINYYLFGLNQVLQQNLYNGFLKQFMGNVQRLYEIETGSLSSADTWTKISKNNSGWNFKTDDNDNACCNYGRYFCINGCKKNWNKVVDFRWLHYLVD